MVSCIVRRSWFILSHCSFETEIVIPDWEGKVSWVEGGE